MRTAIYLPFTAALLKKRVTRLNSTLMRPVMAAFETMRIHTYFSLTSR